MNIIQSSGSSVGEHLPLSLQISTEGKNSIAKIGRDSVAAFALLKSLRLSSWLMLFMLSLGSSIALPAWAATAAAGSANGLGASLTLVPLNGANATLTLGPLPSGVSGSAPPDYSITNSVASANGSLQPLGTIISTGILQASTSSNLARDAANSAAVVNDLTLRVAALLDLTAATVTSTATATCSNGALALSGTATLNNSALNALGVNIAIAANPAPNTRFQFLGLDITLNEQIVSGNSITVNAIHVRFNSAVLTNVGFLSGDVVIAQSIAGLTSTCTSVTPPTGTPDLQLTIGQPVPSLVVNQTSQIPVTLANIGNASSPAPQSVTLTIPAGVSTPAAFANGGWNCTTSGTTVSCSYSSAIAAGSSTAFNVPVTPSASTAGTQPIFSGFAPPAPGETNLVNNSATMVASVPVAGNPQAGTPDLQLTIGQPVPSLVVNQTSQIPVTLANIGNASAPAPQSVMLTIPAGVSTPAAFANGGWNCTTSGTTVSCSYSSAIAAGSSAVFNVPVTPSASTAGTRPIFSGFTPATPGETNLVNNSATMVVSVAVAGNPQTGTPDLQLTIGQPVPSLVVNQTSQITVTLANIGTASAPAPQSVTLTISAGVSTPAAFANGGWNCTTSGTTSGTIVSCSYSSAIAAGSSTAFNVPVTPLASTAGTQPVCSGAASAAPGETNFVNNSATMVVSVAVAGTQLPGVADLQLTIGQPVPSLVVNQTSQIPVTLANIGNASSPAPQSVTLTIPAGVSTPAAFANGGWNCTTSGTTSGTTVSCSYSSVIAAGSSTAFNVPVTPSASSAGTRPTFSGVTSAAPGETNFVNNSATMVSLMIVATLTINYQDHWWNPAESGWGVGIFQQGDTISAVIFVYEQDNDPLWLILSNAARSDGNIFSGALYRTSGPPFNAANFNPAQVGVQQVGTATLRFTDSYNGRLDYTVNGVAISKTITRLTLSPLQPMAGIYRYIRKSTLSSCNNPANNGTTFTSGNVTVTTAGNQYTQSTVFEPNLDQCTNGSAISCSTTGKFQQFGSLLVTAGRTTSCSNGLATSGNSIIRMVDNTFIEQSVASSIVGDNCSEVVTTTGVR